MTQNQKGGEKLFLRMVSAFVLTAFFGTNLAPAQPPAVVSPLKPDQISEVNPLIRIQIPEELGTVREVLSSPGLQNQAPAVIHIQDAHGSYEAQIKIKKILDHLVRCYGISLILVEGAAEPLDSGLFRIFKDQNLNLKVADFLAQEGELSGTELYLMEAADRVQAEGIEDPEMYGQNLKTFREIASKRQEVQNEIGVLRAQIEMLGSRMLNKNLREFLKGWQSWRAEQLSLSEFLSVVQAGARKYLQIDLENATYQFDYPMLVRYYKMKALESEIDLVQAEEERARLHSFLAANKISRAILERIRNWHFKKGVSDWADSNLRHFLARLFEEASPHGFAFERYPALVLLWASLIFQGELESQPFFKEIENITNRILGALALKKEEQELISLFRNSVLLEKLLLLELTREEYQAFLDSPADYSSTGLWRGLRRLGEQNRILRGNRGEKHVLDPADLARLETKARFFYQTALEREGAFFSRVDQMFHKHQTRSVVLVTGGFHSEGVKKRCSERSYSYVEISPRMTSFENLDKVYLQSMLERSQISAARRMAPHRIPESPFYWAQRLGQAIQMAIQTSPDISESEIPGLVEEFNRKSRGYRANIASGSFVVRPVSTAPSQERKQRADSRSEVRTESFEAMEGIDLIRRLPELNQAIHAAENNATIADTLIVLRRDRYLPAVRKGLGDLSRNLMSDQPRPKELMLAIARRLGHPNPHVSDLLIPLLRSMNDNDWETIVADEEVSRLLARELVSFHEYMNRKETWASKHASEIQEKKPIVYFSAEVGIADAPFTAGGLGVLAGNHFYGASDLGFPLVGVGLALKKGYFKQLISPLGDQIVDPSYDGVRLEDLPLESVRIKNQETGNEEDLVVSIPFRGRIVKAKAWLMQYGKVKWYLLDTDVDGNNEQDKKISGYLYSNKPGTLLRMQQYVVLGIGGQMLLKVLGIEPSVIHLNDAHPFFAAIQGIAQEMDNIATTVQDPARRFDTALERVSAKLAFTTHTPVAAGNEVVNIREILKPFLDKIFPDNPYVVDRILALGMRFNDQAQVMNSVEQIDRNHFDVVAFLLRVAQFRNGVSELHGLEVARQMWKGKVFPGIPLKEVPIGYVTNSVHAPSFQAPEITNLFHSTFAKPQVQEAMREDLRKREAKIRDPNWLDNRRNVDVADEDFKQVHLRRKTLLAEEIRRRMQIKSDGGRTSELEQKLLEDENSLDEDALWLGFGRRFNDYKRAPLIFGELDRLAEVAAKAKKPVYLIFAGKAHRQDEIGQQYIRDVYHAGRLLAERGANIKVLFIEDYDIHLARFLDAGVDVWLNNPIRTREASGTSGQKVAQNGGLNLTTNDGWNEEGIVDGVNGFRFGVTEGVGNDAIDREALYNKLEEVIDLHDHHPDIWIRMMKAAVLSTTYRFGMERMLGEYVENIYLPAARQGAGLSVEGAKQNAERRIRKRQEILAAFKSIDSRPSVQISSNVSKHVLRGANFTVRATVDLKGLRPEDIGIDVRYRLRKEGQEAQWEAMEGTAVDLGQGLGKVQYRLRTTIPLTELGTYDIQVRLMPRDLISWQSIDELNQVTVYSDPHEVTTHDDERLLLTELMRKMEKRNFIVAPPDGKETPLAVWEVEAKFPNGNVDMSHWDFYVYWQDGQRKWHAHSLSSRVVVNPEAAGGENVFLLLNMELKAGLSQPVFSKIFAAPRNRDFVITENPADGNWKERKELIWEGTPFDDDLVRRITRVYSDSEHGDEADQNRAEARVSAAPDFSAADLAVVQEVAQSTLDPAMAPSLAIAVFNRFSRPVIAGSIEETPFALRPGLEAAYQAYDQALSNLPSDLLKRKTAVIFSAEDPLALQFLKPAVVKAVLSTNLTTEIKIATQGTDFEDRWNSAILSKASPLSAEEKGRVFRIFTFSNLSFSGLISQAAADGAGVVLQTSEQFNVLDPRTAGLVSGVEELTTDRAAAELIIPIVSAAAILGGLADGRQLTKEELDRIQALLTRQLDELGIRLEVREGRLVGVVLVDTINRLLAEYQARSEIRKAA